MKQGGPEIILHPWDPQQNLTHLENQYIQPETNTLRVPVKAVPYLQKETNFRPRNPKSIPINMKETPRSSAQEMANHPKPLTQTDLIIDCTG